MKACKSCFKELDNPATKCPHCQAFQHWYRNPMFHVVFMFLVVYPLMSYGYSVWSTKEYIDNEDKFVVTEVSDTHGFGHKLTINYSIKNNSNIKWNNVNYEISFYDTNDKLLFVKSGESYGWVVQPEQSSLLSVEVNNHLRAVTWKLRILDMRHNRY